MRVHRALLVARKEWRELAANRLLLLSMISLPLLFTIVPAIVLAVAGPRATAANSGQLAQAMLDAPEGLTAPQLVITLVLRNWIGLFLMLPVFVPIVIAAQSIVGEKERRTLEPLLASPIRTSELLLGKTLAAVVPGVGVTWGAFVLFASLVNWIAFPYFERLVLPDASWVAAVFVVGPALAFFGNTLSVLISSRVTDARLAQQLAGTAVLPLVGAIVFQVIRGTALGPVFFVRAAAVVWVLDGAMYLLAIRLFDRERLLTSLR
jgi:ABC-type Na+ efflux pump permease subunit